MYLAATSLPEPDGPFNIMRLFPVDTLSSCCLKFLNMEDLPINSKDGISFILNAAFSVLRRDVSIALAITTVN